jgi:hypothetical protein
MKRKQNILLFYFRGLAELKLGILAGMAGDSSGNY